MIGLNLVFDNWAEKFKFDYKRELKLLQQKCNSIDIQFYRSKLRENVPSNKSTSMNLF